MPYMKKRTPYKRTYKKKYVRKSKAGNTASIRQPLFDRDPSTYMINKPNPIMTFSRQILGSDTIVDPAVATYAGAVYTTKLDELPSYTEFTSLFQKYRIKYYTVRIRCVDLNAESLIQPTIYMWKNQASGLISAGVTPAYVSQLANVKCMQVDSTRRVIELRIKPYYLGINYAGVTPGYTQTGIHASDWLDCAYTDIEHYSIGVMVDNLTPGGTGVKFIVDEEIVVEFKQYQ